MSYRILLSRTAEESYREEVYLFQNLVHISPVVLGRLQVSLSVSTSAAASLTRFNLVYSFHQPIQLD